MEGTLILVTEEAAPGARFGKGRGRVPACSQETGEHRPHSLSHLSEQ